MIKLEVLPPKDKNSQFTINLDVRTNVAPTEEVIAAISTLFGYYRALLAAQRLPEKEIEKHMLELMYLSANQGMEQANAFMGMMQTKSPGYEQ